MNAAHPQTQHPGAVAFGSILRALRNSRQQSQLDLGLAAGVSTRHISFLETGRANPSRDMVLELARALELPAGEQNRLLIAAGFAPLISTNQRSEPAATEPNTAIALGKKN